MSTNQHLTSWIATMEGLVTSDDLAGDGIGTQIDDDWGIAIKQWGTQVWAEISPGLAPYPAVAVAAGDDGASGIRPAIEQLPDALARHIIRAISAYQAAVAAVGDLGQIGTVGQLHRSCQQLLAQPAAQPSFVDDTLRPA